MPGDPLKYVQSNTPLTLSADAWNAFIDTTKQFRARQRTQKPGDPQPLPWPLTFAQVQNTTEDDLDRFAVLGIDAPIIPPSDNADTFAERVRINGVEPTSDHVGTGKFVILLEPCAAGNVALCAIAGATVCLINVGEEWHKFVDAKSGTTDSAVSAAIGPLRILWKESGTGAGKWAVVRFTEVDNGPLIVGCTKDGGSAGSTSATCSFTYTITDHDGNELEAGLTPDRPRLVHVEYELPADGSPGLAYYTDGAWRLYEAVQEQPKIDDECPDF